jgi:hypothetical protein
MHTLKDRHIAGHIAGALDVEPVIQDGGQQVGMAHRLVVSPITPNDTSARPPLPTIPGMMVCMAGGAALLHWDAPGRA